ncbi:MAG: hypothetical protein E6R03_10825 [Hyphomicrobiaceae bacterium]|nr:MAG: hypothetical protein E6R03_10825 [Hyphomicrobiaceae bacterium]
MARKPITTQEETSLEPEKKRGRAKSRPRCYGCDNRARPDSIFCSDRCGCGYADQLIGEDSGNDQEWCPVCDTWEVPDPEKETEEFTTVDKAGNVVSKQVIRFLECGHKSSGKPLYKGAK